MYNNCACALVEPHCKDQSHESSQVMFHTVRAGAYWDKINGIDACALPLSQVVLLSFTYFLLSVSLSISKLQTNSNLVLKSFLYVSGTLKFTSLTILPYCI